MTRQEKALAAITATLVLVFTLSLVSGLSRWLNGQGWFAQGANEIQWAGGLATFAGVALVVWWYWSRRCAVPTCLRLGEHPVAKTTKKVCGKHHTAPHHMLVHDLHRVEGYLGWGESHGR